MEFVAGFAVVFLALSIYFWMKYKKAVAFSYELQEVLDKKSEEIHSLKIEYATKDMQLEHMGSLKDELFKAVKKLQLRDEELMNLRTLNSTLSTKLEEQEKNHEEKLQIYQKNEENLKKEFKNLANEILDLNSKKISEQNKQNLDLILNPMKQQISEFKKKVEDVYDKESKDRTFLQAEINQLKELNHKISNDAINLTNALKGDSKKQGIWGEMVLEKVLESSGLREGKEYEREKHLTGDDDKSFRPDVIINLPNDRHIIIDAKTSLRAYEEYIACEDENQKEVFLTKHIVAIKDHIKTLSSKNYEKLKEVNSLDFIFMFIPIEGALLLAMQNDTSLFDNAFKQRIILVSPTTLLVALRAVENSWRYEKQAKNTEEVIKRAELLYTKFVNFIEDLDEVGKSLGKANEKYESAYNKLKTGRGNIIGQIELLKQRANIKAKKNLEEDLKDTAISELNKNDEKILKN